MNDDRIWKEALAPLKEAVPEPDARLQRRLLAEFRKRHPVRKARLWLGAAGALAAVVAMAIVLFRPDPGRRAQLPVVAARTKAAPEQSRKAVAHAARKRRVRPAAQAAATFYALPYAGQSEPLDRGTVVRVSLPRSAMAAVGFPVNPDRMFEPVQADVILGDDGLARAIRFVQ